MSPGRASSSSAQATVECASSDDDLQPRNSEFATRASGFRAASGLDATMLSRPASLHVITPGQRDWRRTHSAPGSACASNWLEDFSSPLQDVRDWASSLSRTISDGVAAIAEEFSSWSTGSNPSDEGAAEFEARGAARSGSVSPGNAPSAQSPLPCTASCHDYFQPQELHLPEVEYKKKDK